MSSKYALLIGITEYSDSKLPTLKWPAADVDGLVHVLKDPQIGAFTSVERRINITSQEARTQIAQFFGKKKTNDLLLLYFSGHGVRDSAGRLYLAFSDTQDEYLDANAISASWIRELIDKTLSKKVILILDCCYSGAFDRGSKSIVGANVGTGGYFDGTGRVVLAASDAFQLAWEGDKVVGSIKNSLFTHYLVEGLSSGNADRDADGIIMIDELFDYVHDKVISDTKDQTPCKWNYKQSGKIIVAKNIQYSKIELPQELQEAINSNEDWKRIGAIYKLGLMLNSKNLGERFTARSYLTDLAESSSYSVSQHAKEQLNIHTQNTNSTSSPQQIRNIVSKPIEEVESISKNVSLNNPSISSLRIRFYELLFFCGIIIGPLFIALSIDWLLMRLLEIVFNQPIYQLPLTSYYPVFLYPLPILIVINLWSPVNILIIMIASDIRNDVKNKVYFCLKSALDVSVFKWMIIPPINFLTYWIVVRLLHLWLFIGFPDILDMPNNRGSIRSDNVLILSMIILTVPWLILCMNQYKFIYRYTSMFNK